MTDREADRAKHLASLAKVRHYPTLCDVLNDTSVDLVLNLTNPRSHYEVSKASLIAGKHVYSEKPLAMQMGQAAELLVHGVGLHSADLSFHDRQTSPSQAHLR